jgi:hypothetical protein
MQREGGADGMVVSAKLFHSQIYNPPPVTHGPSRGTSIPQKIEASQTKKPCLLPAGRASACECHTAEAPKFKWVVPADCSAYSNLNSVIVGQRSAEWASCPRAHSNFLSTHSRCLCRTTASVACRPVFFPSPK